MKIESKLKNHKGHVILPDFLTLKQVRAFEDAYFGGEAIDADGAKFVSVSVERLLPFLMEHVKEWKLENVGDNPEEYPYKVLRWVAQQFVPLWQSEIDIPKE